MPGCWRESPFAIPSKKLVMWLFIISDAVTFGALLFAYGYVKNASPELAGTVQVLPQHRQRAADDVYPGDQQPHHDRSRLARPRLVTKQTEFAGPLSRWRAASCLLCCTFESGSG